jgi:deferrochelatase/peroxidase EfeB
LFLKFSANTGANKEWLRQIHAYIGYGDTLLARSVVVVAFSASGLRKLGLNDRQITTFPVAFQQGSAASWRARAMGDIGANAPENWVWGTAEHEADAVMLIYAVDHETLSALVETRTEEFAKAGHEITYEIVFEPVPERPHPTIEPFGFVDGVSDPVIRGIGRWTLDENSNHLVEAGEIVLGYPDNSGFMPASPTVTAGDDPNNILPAVAPDSARMALDSSPQRPDFTVPQPTGPRDLGFNGSFLVVRHLEQDTDAFTDYLNDTATQIATDPRLPSKELVPTDDWKTPIQDWIAAKMVGRWHDGTSLVRHPHRSSSKAGRPVQPDNDFLFGAEDPTGVRCPFGAHIRRANPRDNLIPNLPQQLAITNRHRILRVGRPYRPQNALSKPGLVFMCLNADIERQFEFLQQIWILGRSFQALENEVDAIIGHGGASGTLTIPTTKGALRLKGMKDFVTVRGSGYFFLPGQRALHFLAQ